MSNNDEQKKNEVSEKDESAEVSSTSPDSPVAEDSEESKDTEKAESCSSPDQVPDPTVNGKKMNDSLIDKNDEPSQSQLNRESDPSMTNSGPGEITKPFIIEISDDESDTSPESSPESSPEPSPISDGPQLFQ
ncbi:uncharacterized protein LOC126780425 [Nymphalis io]|uniref:uncharacterized protein LOC126780425 n=1 Tax=Inachis io TaxID=171585 RepID=UPI0021679713|nr:uncharacterized protein LOC126780425 [Nymphalis io]XP_050360864.1 uncharacterized protein LOC126780425 [Nymphalis io]